jgi:hypothetical protein
MAPLPLTYADHMTAPRVPTPPAVEWGYVDDDGRLVISPEMRRSLGLEPGARLRLEREGNTIRLHRPLGHLAKVYVEPTNACNLDCVTCFRNAWESPLGRMSEETFAAVMAGVAAIDPPPTVYFGGIGEPLAHHRTLAWIAQAKQLGARVELITNGTLLTAATSQALIDAGLDLLWVSIDGARRRATPTCAWAPNCPTCSPTCATSAHCARGTRPKSRRSASPSWP